ncbi:MAG: hypothetical protein PHV24_04760 [Candidatus Kapabacteria bacterium]|nr:hypothetical protein [Candidatus Kapabacteria bacterium]
MKKIILAIAVLVLVAMQGFAQVPKVAFIPYTNMDGNMELNKWCYSLQDSLQKYFAAADAEEKSMKIVPFDEIEIILADMNLDPTNPQFASDMWKVVEQLNVDYVISGNFVLKANRFLINTYIYDVNMKLPVTTNQARDIFVPLDNVLKAIRPIGKKLQGFFIK